MPTNKNALIQLEITNDMDIIKNIESTPDVLTKIVEGWEQKQNPSFDELATSVLQTHQTAQYSAIRAVNQMATENHKAMI